MSDHQPSFATRRLRKRLEDWTKVGKWLPRCIKSISDENLVSDWKPATLEIRVGSMRNEPV